MQKVWRSDRDVPSRHRQKRERRKYNRANVAAPDWLIEYAEGGRRRYVTIDAKNRRELTVHKREDAEWLYLHDDPPHSICIEIHDFRFGLVFRKMFWTSLHSKDFFPQLRKFLLTEGRTDVWNTGRRMLARNKAGAEFRAALAKAAAHRLASWGEGKAV